MNKKEKHIASLIKARIHKKRRNHIRMTGTKNDFIDYRVTKSNEIFEDAILLVSHPISYDMFICKYYDK